MTYEKLTYEEIEVGRESSLSLTVTPELVEQYAGLVGDTNPVHLDPEFAATSFFRKRIAHGMLAGGLVSAVLGTRLPGPGAIYLSQDFEFTRPIDINDVLTARVQVVEKYDRHKKLKLRTWVENRAGQPVLDGAAVLLVR
ncbi:MAG: MaoC family dehydratase [Candidatus Adiutrix sp.]|jgi:3-hydroxybutyryl-CoA dehydratase|nr:MaoC family dehydratase [Candidatus Adiutrix sp.]